MTPPLGDGSPQEWACALRNAAWRGAGERVIDVNYFCRPAEVSAVHQAGPISWPHSGHKREACCSASGDQRNLIS